MTSNNNNINTIAFKKKKVSKINIVVAKRVTIYNK